MWLLGLPVPAAVRGHKALLADGFVRRPGDRPGRGRPGAIHDCASIWRFVTRG